MRTLLFALFVLAPGLTAADPAPAAPPVNKPAPIVETKPEAPSMLKITIDSSRSTIMLGTRAGLSAEIRNVSQTELTLTEQSTVFVVVPELRKGELLHGCATFPTRGLQTAPGGGASVTIQPGDSYRVFWDMDYDGCTGKDLSSFSLKWIDFQPGTYRVYLNVKFTAANTGATYHTSYESKDVAVSAPYWLIILGSFGGGVVAWFIKQYYGATSALTSIFEGNDTWRQEAVKTVECIMSGVFASVLVILSARLPDTFPVKINANDLLGSFALGFVFQWIGVKILEKLPGMSSAAGATAAATAPPATAPPVIRVPGD